MLDFQFSNPDIDLLSLFFCKFEHFSYQIKFQNSIDFWKGKNSIDISQKILHFKVTKINYLLKIYELTHTM